MFFNPRRWRGNLLFLLAPAAGGGACYFLTPGEAGGLILLILNQCPKLCNFMQKALLFWPIVFFLSLDTSLDTIPRYDFCEITRDERGQVLIAKREEILGAKREESLGANPYLPKVPTPEDRPVCLRCRFPGQPVFAQGTYS